MEIEKKKTALLIMDFQNDIVHEKGKFVSWGIPAHVKKQNAIGNARKLLEKARESGFKVIFITVSYENGYPELRNAKEGYYSTVSQTNSLLKGTWGAEIHEDLKPLDNELVINKSRINPFTTKDLLNELADVGTLILAGVATNFVLEETVRSAAAMDFRLIVAEDCCASMSQEMHDFPIKNILPNFASIKKTDEICKSF